MTDIDDLTQGDIVWAGDPLSNKGRPMLILATPEFPSHGVQLITVLLSTRSYHEEAVVLRDGDYDADPLDERSYALPWSLVTFDSVDDVDLYLTPLTEERTAAVAEQSADFISPA